MLVIEIAPEDVKTETRIIPASGDRQARTVYDQTVLFRLGGRSVIESRLSHDSADAKLSAGLYTLDGSSYQINNFGGVELKNGYQQTIIPLAAAIQPFMAQLKMKEF